MKYEMSELLGDSLHEMMSCEWSARRRIHIGQAFCLKNNKKKVRLSSDTFLLGTLTVNPCPAE